MNPIIKKQLENCRVANIPDFDDSTKTITIPKGSALTVTPYQVGKFYLVELADYVINPPEGYTLASNWNKGTSPKYKYYPKLLPQPLRFLSVARRRQPDC